MVKDLGEGKFSRYVNICWPRNTSNSAKSGRASYASLTKKCAKTAPPSGLKTHLHLQVWILVSARPSADPQPAAGVHWFFLCLTLIHINNTCPYVENRVYSSGSLYIMYSVSLYLFSVSSWLRPRRASSSCSCSSVIRSFSDSSCCSCNILFSCCRRMNLSLEKQKYTFKIHAFILQW